MTQPYPAEAVERLKSFQEEWRFRSDERGLASDNRRAARELKLVRREDWPLACSLVSKPPSFVWRSSEFLVMLYEHEEKPRLSICRTSLYGDRFADNISWDEIQRLKREAGFGETCAIEIFPPDSAVVNVANMRHIWLVEPPAFMW